MKQKYGYSLSQARGLITGGVVVLSTHPQSGSPMRVDVQGAKRICFDKQQTRNQPVTPKRAVTQLTRTNHLPPNLPSPPPYRLQQISSSTNTRDSPHANPQLLPQLWLSPKRQHELEHKPAKDSQGFLALWYSTPISECNSPTPRHPTDSTMPDDVDDDFITQTRSYFREDTKWQFAAFAKYCYNLPDFPFTSQNLRRQTAWTHWEHHLRDIALESDQAKKAKAGDLLQRIQKKRQSQVNVQNFTINAIGGTNTINATPTGTAITTTTNLNPTGIVNNVDGVEIKQESPVARVPLKEERSSPTKRKFESEAEAEYAPWPATPPLPRKRRQTTTRTTPYTDAQPAQLRSALPATNLPPPTALPIRQRLILLQDKLTKLEHHREHQLARLRVQWVKFKEADGRMGEVVREVKEELGRIVEEREMREGDEMLTSKDETARGSQEEWRSE